MPFIEEISFRDAERYVSEMNIDEPGTLTHKAASIIIWCLAHQTWNTRRVRNFSGYDWSDIRTIIRNLRNNGFCSEGGLIDIELGIEDLPMELTLLAGCAAGEFRRCSPDGKKFPTYN